MESVERKNASAGPEEVIKSEGMVPSPDTSERSNSAPSPPPNCCICLGKLINTSFTDSCLHQFCFTCLLQWSKIKTECPLCKQTFKSIIHNVRSEEDYDQYHVQYTSQVPATLDVTDEIRIGQLDVTLARGLQPFMYRTTMASNHPRYGMLLNPESVARREQIPNIVLPVSNEERRPRSPNMYLNPRESVYSRGMWAAPLPGPFMRFRECSATYYRLHPEEVNRLIPWLNRELQVLLHHRPRIAYAMNVITNALVQHNINSAQFRNIVRPFFRSYTNHFVHEFANFARSNYDVVGYDQAVSYIGNIGLSSDYVSIDLSPTSSSFSSSSDSDVRVVNNNVSSQSTNPVNVVGSLTNDMPGPSSVGGALRLQLPYQSPNVYTISSTSSSSENECEVIGYVKPRHERTPEEIIDLSSSDAEEVNISTQPTSNDNTNNLDNKSGILVPLSEENMPSTSSSYDNTSGNRRTRRRTEDPAKTQIYDYLDSSSESDDKESDSDYNPLRSKSRRHKSTSKKASKVSLLRGRKRKKSVTAKRKSRTHSNYSSYNDSDNESPSREASSCSRGTKRYLSKNSDTTDSEKQVKKNKKSKKSKSLKKGSKRGNQPSCSSSCTSSSSSSWSDTGNTDASEDKTTCATKTASFGYRRSRSSSLDRWFSRHSMKTGVRCTSAYSDGDDDSPGPVRKLKSTSASSSKSDASSPNEHSASSKASRGRYRSHKKRKESKKRRSRS